MIVIHASKKNASKKRGRKKTLLLLNNGFQPERNDPYASTSVAPRQHKQLWYWRSSPTNSTLTIGPTPGIASGIDAVPLPAIHPINSDCSVSDPIEVEESASESADHNIESDDGDDDETAVVKTNKLPTMYDLFGSDLDVPELDSESDVPELEEEGDFDESASADPSVGGHIEPDVGGDDDTVHSGCTRVRFRE